MFEICFRMKISNFFFEQAHHQVFPAKKKRANEQQEYTPVCAGCRPAFIDALSGLLASASDTFVLNKYSKQEVKVEFHYCGTRQQNGSWVIHFRKGFQQPPGFAEYICSHERGAPFRTRLVDAGNNTLSIESPADFRTLPFHLQKLASPAAIWSENMMEPIREYFRCMHELEPHARPDCDPSELDAFQLLLTLYELNIEYELRGKMLLPPGAAHPLSPAAFWMLDDKCTVLNIFDICAATAQISTDTTRPRYFWNPRIGYYSCRLLEVWTG